MEHTPGSIFWQRDGADTWVPMKLEVHGWVTDWSQKHLTGTQEDQVKVVLGETEKMMPKEAR